MKLWLYGLKVEAGDYVQLKQLTDLLVGFTSAGVKRQSARRACLQIARQAVTRARGVK